MALESEYVPEQTSHPSSLPPEHRGVYNKIFWGLIGSYVAIVMIMGAVVVSNIDFGKTADVVVTRTWAR